MRTVILIATIAAMGCATMGSQGSVPSQPTMPAVQALADYHFGDSREALTVVEVLVRDAANGGSDAGALADDLAALVVSGATPEARLFACRQLALIGSDRHVTALAPLLVNPETSDMARYALEPIPGRKVDRAFLDALAAAPASIKPGLINSLGARAAGRAANALEAYAESGDPVIAEAARSALIKIDG